MKKSRKPNLQNAQSSDEKLNNYKYDLKYFRSLQNILNAAGPAASASYTLTGSILIFSFLGWYFEKHNQTSPAGLFIGLFSGLLIGFYNLFKIIKQKN